MVHEGKYTIPMDCVWDDNVINACSHPESQTMFTCIGTYLNVPYWCEVCFRYMHIIGALLMKEIQNNHLG